MKFRLEDTGRGKRCGDEEQSSKFVFGRSSYQYGFLLVVNHKLIQNIFDFLQIPIRPYYKDLEETCTHDN